MANKPSKVDKFAHLLGAITDKQLAKLAGLGEAASVQSQRKKKNIPAFRSNCSKIKKALKTLKEDVSDAEAAKELDVPLSLFSAMRHHDELKTEKTKTIKKYKLDKEVVKAVLELDTHSKPGRKKGSKTKKKISTVALKKEQEKKSKAKKEAKAESKKETKKATKKKAVKKKVVKKKSAVKKEAAVEIKKETKKKATKKKSAAKKQAKTPDVKVSSVKKEAKAESKKETKKKATKKKSAAKKENNTVVFEQAYECSFLHGDDRTSLYITAASLLDASKKLGKVEKSKAIKGSLVSITHIGSALA